MAIDTDAYEEMISMLTQFLSDVIFECDAMDEAATDLRDSMHGDKHAANQADTLSDCVNDIRGALGQINEVITSVQRELQEAQNFVPAY